MLRKVENYRQALERLKEAVGEYAQRPESTTLRDGVIQRFEFTFELAWKSIKEYLEDQGVSPAGLTFPKAVLKRAYADGLLQDEAVWLSMLEARNLTSHVYSDDQAAQVATAIQDSYMSHLEALASHYRKS